MGQFTKMPICMNNTFRLSIFFPILFTLASGCSTGIFRTPNPISFPDRKVVFQANDGYKYALGFMNDDGTGVVIHTTGGLRISLPVWSEDKQSIYFINFPPRPGDMEDLSIGSVGYLRNGNFAIICSNNSYVSWTIYPIVQNDLAIYLDSPSTKIGIFNISKCKSEKILVDTSNAQVLPNFIFCINVSKDRRFIIYSESDGSVDESQYDLKLYDIMTGKITIVGKGFSPSISTDNHQIAFFRLDGIYVMDFAGTNIRRLVDFGSNLDSNNFSIPPIPYWSSDNQWLIYHRCKSSINSDCHYGHDFSIFKVRVSTGDEIKLYDGGLYPYW